VVWSTITDFEPVDFKAQRRNNSAPFVHSAGGGAGLATLDIAKKMGATTYGA